MKALVFNPRSINCSRAGGAEIYLHEILSRIKECGFLVISSSDRKSSYQHQSYTEDIVSGNEYLFPIFSAKYAKHIRNFDIIIENVSKFPIIWPPILSKLLSKPFIAIVYHIHGKTLFRELPSPVALILSIYEIFALKIYSLLGAFMITVSTSTERELLRLGFPKHRVSIISPGLSLELKSSGTVKSKKPLVAYIGRIKKYKRVDHLVNAMKIVRQSIPDTKCIVAGKGDKKVYKELRDLVEKLGLKTNITFEGEVTEDKKLDLMRKAWIYVITSMKEGFSISALEAQASGTPVIGYKIPGLVDCVKNGITGLLVSDGDYRALAEAIVHLLLHEDSRLKMSRNAVRHALSFSWDRSAENFMKIILQVASK